MPFTSRSNAASGLAAFIAIVAIASILFTGSAAAGSGNGNENLCNITFPRLGKTGSKGKAAALPLTLTGRSGAAPGAGGAIAHGSAIGETLTKFVLEKAVGINIERWALTGMGNLFRLLNLGHIAPDSTEQKILRQLHAINARLDEMEVRIERVGASVNNLTAERRQKDLDHEVTAICSIADRQMYYYGLFQNAMDAGEELGQALEKVEPSSTTDSPTVKALRTAAQADMNEFIDQSKLGAATTHEQLGRLRRALVPSTKPNTPPTVLKTYGLVLMAKNRFLRHEHSQAMRDLYGDVSEIRALTSWMAAEYYQAQGNSRQEGKVWDEFVEDHRDAEAALPKMIPPGVVVDLGDEPRSSTDEKPMWLAPTEKDLGWLPPAHINGRVFQINEVDHALDALNDRRYTQRDDWHAPDKQEFLALISSGCSANPHKPSQPLVGCKNAVPGGANIAAYLQKINEPDKTWQKLFCQSSVNKSCPPDAGPSSSREPHHAFIWTSDLHSQRLICGETRGNEIAPRFNTHAGYFTLGPVKHELFPHYPMRIPDPRAGVQSVVEEACAEYIRKLIGGSGARRNRLFEGVLLATRFSSAADLNRLDQLDFMAQPIARKN